MTDIKEDSIVKCAYCRKNVKVAFIIEHEGETAYNLDCFHRNTFMSDLQPNGEG